MTCSVNSKQRKERNNNFGLKRELESTGNEVSNNKEDQRNAHF